MQKVMTNIKKLESIGIGNSEVKLVKPTSSFASKQKRFGEKSDVIVQPPNDLE
jgi:hypothetical protein